MDLSKRTALLGANEYLGWASKLFNTGYWKSTYTDGVSFGISDYAFAALIANVEGKTTMTYSDNQGGERGAVYGMKSDGTITFLGPTRSYNANQQYTFNISQYDYILAGCGYGYAGITVSFS